MHGKNRNGAGLPATEWRLLPPQAQHLCQQQQGQSLAQLAHSTMPFQAPQTFAYRSLGAGQHMLYERRKHVILWLPAEIACLAGKPILRFQRVGVLLTEALELRP